ncbi:hypothetical protein EQZ09_12170 [Clostridium perfringens]|nr:hypothetical protein [Clostridium perfringens]
MRYDDFISTVQGSDYEDWIYDDELGVYLFKEDINISIKVDREQDIDDRGFYEEWATQNPDAHAYREKYYLMYGNNIIETICGASVDGSRCFIPYPRLDNMTITHFKDSVAQIINFAGAGHDYERYLRSAGITVED